MDIKDLGLSADLIEAAKLVGAQKKIDKNGNGKLDADDFKKLRKEETVEEEVEELDELSKATLANYTQKAAHDVGNKMHRAGSMAITSHVKHSEGSTDLSNYYDRTSKAAHSKALTRLQGIKTAAKKLSQEQVEEIEALAAKHGLGE